jgi:type I restriction enzyme, R subunit
MQLTHEVIIDNDFVNRSFSTDRGAKRLDKILGSHLDQVLEGLAEGGWERAG